MIYGWNIASQKSTFRVIQRWEVFYFFIAIKDMICKKDPNTRYIQIIIVFSKNLDLIKRKMKNKSFLKPNTYRPKCNGLFSWLSVRTRNIKFSMAKFLTFTQNCHWCSAYNLSMSFLYDISVVDGMSSPLIMKQRGSYWVKFCVYIVYAHTAKSLWFYFPS